ncbi:glycoside hydrolase family 16 protein [Gaoshiqia sp. Z1-71]|uniref:glycoside hydrolase family 16 protein n=1 Tax=Gaoshiqia hydrogeniformans TaxID=3290090 RepID=UPI003BF775C9
MKKFLLFSLTLIWCLHPGSLLAEQTGCGIPAEPLPESHAVPGTADDRKKPATESVEFDRDKNRKLVWSDEFDYDGLPDSVKWDYQVGGHGWGNNELQYYTRADSNNVNVKNGQLELIARAQPYDTKNYTSVRLVTRHKGDWKYGRVEVRAQLPQGRGLWPAIWMLPTENNYGGWPKSGEIDIMEHVGYNPDSVFFTVHTEHFNHMIGTQKGKSAYLAEMYDAFHVYAIDWDEHQIDFFVDGNFQHTFKNSGKGPGDWPFDQAFYLLLNVAVGGNWGGKHGVDDQVFPAAMLIDYVRVFQ